MIENETDRLSMAMDARDAFADIEDGGVSDATVQAALASLTDPGRRPEAAAARRA